VPPGIAPDVVTVRLLLIVIEQLAVPVRLAASVTFTVKELVPAVCGVPVIAPVELLMDSPAGRLPTLIDQV